MEQVITRTTELEQLFKKFLDMGYVSNHSSAINTKHKFFKIKFIQFFFALAKFIVNYFRGNVHKHETRVEEVLHDSGYEEITFDDLGITREEAVAGRRYLPDEADVPEKCYISQPLGGSRSPDFIIVYKRRILYIECKSNKQDKINFGLTLPRDGYIYLFTCGKHDQSVAFLGHDVMNDDIREKCAALVKEIREKQEKFNEDILADENNPHGFVMYWANYIQQCGKNGEAKWVEHKNIDQYIENVLDFVKEV